MKLVLPLPPLGNHYKDLRIIRVGARHVPQWFLTKEAQAFKRDTAKYALACGIFPTLKPVSVSVDVYRARKIGDADGWTKVLLDALEGVCFENDKQVRALHVFVFDDKANPRVEVEVTEITAADFAAREKEIPA